MSNFVSTPNELRFKKEVERALWDAYDAGQASLMSDVHFDKSDSKSVATPFEGIGKYWVAVGNVIRKATTSFKASQQSSEK
ncbi:MAG: hypothetical protein AMXMBFR84_25840 [Candidatus Hydrogenedentota bacterium]